jgi:hypothetical protein
MQQDLWNSDDKLKNAATRSTSGSEAYKIKSLGILLLTIILYLAVKTP